MFGVDVTLFLVNESIFIDSLPHCVPSLCLFLPSAASILFKLPVFRGHLPPIRLHFNTRIRHQLRKVTTKRWHDLDL
jgi:hypothetical protein